MVRAVDPSCRQWDVDESNGLASVKLSASVNCFCAVPKKGTPVAVTSASVAAARKSIEPVFWGHHGNDGEGEVDTLLFGPNFNLPHLANMILKDMEDMDNDLEWNETIAPLQVDLTLPKRS